jgi:hypothetical protein
MHEQHVAPVLELELAAASRNGSDSMSPTVPPISTMCTSAWVAMPSPRIRPLDLVGDVRDHLHRAAQDSRRGRSFDRIES